MNIEKITIDGVDHKVEDLPEHIQEIVWRIEGIETDIRSHKIEIIEKEGQKKALISAITSMIKNDVR